MSNVIYVKMGEMHIGHSPDVLETMGVGSCLVIIMYDPVVKIGGLAHAMLPTSPREEMNTRSLLYVDTTIDELLQHLTATGVDLSSITAKLIGGAHMFPHYGEASSGIGSRNIEKAKESLYERNILLSGEETGGTVGRNVRFNLSTGICDIETKM